METVKDFPLVHVAQSVDFVMLCCETGLRCGPNKLVTDGFLEGYGTYGSEGDLITTVLGNKGKVGR